MLWSLTGSTGARTTDDLRAGLSCDGMLQTAGGDLQVVFAAVLSADKAAMRWVGGVVRTGLGASRTWSDRMVCADRFSKCPLYASYHGFARLHLILLIDYGFQNRLRCVMPSTTVHGWLGGSPSSGAAFQREGR